MLFAAGFSLGSHVEREQGCEAGLPIQLEKAAIVLAFSLVLVVLRLCIEVATQRTCEPVVFGVANNSVTLFTQY